MSKRLHGRKPWIGVRRTKLFEESVGCKCFLQCCMGLIVATLGMVLVMQQPRHPVVLATGIILTSAGLYVIIHSSLLAWGYTVETLLIHLCPGRQGFNF